MMSRSVNSKLKYFYGWPGLNHKPQKKQNNTTVVNPGRFGLIMGWVDSDLTARFSDLSTSAYCIFHAKKIRCDAGNFPRCTSLTKRTLLSFFFQR